MTLVELLSCKGRHLVNNQVLDDDGLEILLPAIEDVILKVDIEAGEMTADISNLV